jgi:putative PIN family toxin of toxin-antitoxin system
MQEENRCKVVIDTNVFVSGLNFKGTPREVLDLIWKKKIEVYISPFIIEELRDTLLEDFAWDNEEVKEVIERIKDQTIQVQPSLVVSVIKGKDSDNRILECAVEGKAQYIVSGDKRHLLSLKEYQGIRILSSADFLQLFLK